MSLTMPTKHAAIKDLRKNRKRAVHNARIRSHVRFLLKKNQELISSGDISGARQAASALQQALDKAAKVGVLSRNKADRKKSKFMKSATKK